MKPKKIVPILLLTLSLLTLVFLLFKNNSLAQNLALQETHNTQLLNQLKGHEELAEIDSMLLKGQYRQALNSYEESMRISTENNFAIPLRIALAEKLLHSNKSKIIAEENNETTDLNMTSGLELSALTKTKVQLARLKGQMKNRSLGAYLKFKSKKGNLLHYVGEVKKGKANGYGIALLDSGSRYEGQWKDNQRQGEGTFYWPDGEYYVGTYENDKRSGFGTYYWPNGEKYAGEWKEDKRSGSGKFFGTDGDVIAGGEWDDDKLIEVNEK
jgi:hypothetical protein